MALRPTENDVRIFLNQLLCEIGKIPVERIHDDAGIDSELRMESVTFIEIQVALEENYDVELDPVLILELNRYGAIVRYIHDSILTAFARVAG